MRALIVTSLSVACFAIFAIDPQGLICIAGQSQSGTWELQLPRSAIEHGQTLGTPARYQAKLLVRNEDGTVLAEKPVYLIRSWRVPTTGQYGLTIALDNHAKMDIRSDADPAGYMAAMAMRMGLTLTASAVIAPVHEWEPQKSLIQPKSWALAKKLI